MRNGRMVWRGIHIIVATAIMFFASLPGICATLCQFKACPEMTGQAQAAPHSCCGHKTQNRLPASKCQVEMNKEPPAATHAAAPALDFEILVLPPAVPVGIAGVDMPRVQVYPPLYCHPPPSALAGVIGSRAPPIQV